MSAYARDQWFNEGRTLYDQNRLTVARFTVATDARSAAHTPQMRHALKLARRAMLNGRPGSASERALTQWECAMRAVDAALGTGIHHKRKRKCAR